MNIFLVNVKHTNMNPRDFHITRIITLDHLTVKIVVVFISQESIHLALKWLVFDSRGVDKVAKVQQPKEIRWLRNRIHGNEFVHIINHLLLYRGVSLVNISKVYVRGEDCLAPIILNLQSV